MELVSTTCAAWFRVNADQLATLLRKPRTRALLDSIAPRGNRRKSQVQRHNSQRKKKRADQERTGGPVNAIGRNAENQWLEPGEGLAVH
jgi:hypothetical protein